MNINRPVFRVLCRIITAGSKKHVSYEHPLPGGPKIFASNHPGNIDPAYFYHLMGNPALLIMKWGFDVPVLGRIMRGCGHIPVGNGHAAYSAALNELLKGRNVCIFPEGKLSEPEVRPKTGAVRLSIQAGVPIVPVGIRHHGRVYRLKIRGHVVKFMPLGSTRIRFGLPWYHFYRDHNESVRRLMDKIKLLSEL